MYSTVTKWAGLLSWNIWLTSTQNLVLKNEKKKIIEGREWLTIAECPSSKVNFTCFAAPYVSVSLNADGVVLECRKTKKANGINPVWNQGFLFDVVNERIDDYSLTIKVINHDLLSNNELIGQLTIGPQCKGTGREHWEEAMTKKFNRREVSMTHILDPC